MKFLSYNRVNGLHNIFVHKGISYQRLFSLLKTPAVIQQRHFAHANVVKTGVVGTLDLEEICRTGNIPKTFNFAKDVFDWHAQQRPNDPALWFCNERNEDRIWSFEELRYESIKTALFLQKLLKDELKVRANQKQHGLPFVLTILSRTPEWWFLHMGAIRTGIIFCPGTTLLTQEDIEYRLEASSAHMIITDEENAEKVDKAYQRLVERITSTTKKVLKKVIIVKNENSKGDWINYNAMINKITEMEISNFKHAETKSNEVSQAFFTSGTTGKPKMVAHVHSSYGIGHVETARQLQLGPTDVFWNISDPGWAKSSYSNFFAPWIAGSTVFIHQMKRFEAKPVLEVLSSKPISTLCAPPTLYRTMVLEPREAFQFKALKKAIGAGELVNTEVMRAWKEKTGFSLEQAYGQTEFTVLGCQLPSDDKKESFGKPNGMYRVKIVNESGKEVPAGEEGIIALQVKPTYPVGLFRGYMKPSENGPIWDTEKNSECFVGDVYLTGDKCYMDDEGYIYFVGRADDIINSSGYRIGPTEVESALQTHPAVVESAAVASPDSERGEVVKAFIVLHEKYRNVDKKELTVDIQNHVKRETAPYKYPRKVEFVESLPKTISGKILRRELKKLEYAKSK